MLTIREAVWLTDNSYKYEELVRMMGEIISALEGKIRVSLESGWNIPPPPPLGCSSSQAVAVPELGV